MHPDSALYSCPHLGLCHDRRQRCVVPDSGHQCYYRSRPRPVSLQHQAQYCLHPGHYTCPTLARSQSRPAIPLAPAASRVWSVGVASLAALLLVSMAAAFHIGEVEWESATKALISQLTRPPERTVADLPKGDEATPVNVHQETPTTGRELIWELSLPTMDEFDSGWSPSTPVSVAKREPIRPVPSSRPSSRPNLQSATRLVSAPSPDADQLVSQPSEIPSAPGSPDSSSPPASRTPDADPPRSPTPTPEPATPSPEPPAVKTPLGQIVSAIVRHQGAEVSQMAKDGGLGDAPKLCPGQNLNASGNSKLK